MGECISEIGLVRYSTKLHEVSAGGRCVQLRGWFMRVGISSVGSALAFDLHAAGYHFDGSSNPIVGVWWTVILPSVSVMPLVVALKHFFWRHHIFHVAAAKFGGWGV